MTLELSEDRLREFFGDADALKKSAERIHAIISDREQFRQLTEDSEEFDALILTCLQAIVHLHDASYPTRPRVDLERDGYEFRSGAVGFMRQGLGLSIISGEK